MDDMVNAWTDIAFMTEEQYQLRLAAKLERQEKKGSATNEGP